ncbi:hypothetical protein FACS189461_4380 [Spirochaetia bacterium]|nr:hypothetical protein FACS189461_4380 [Spirochaetia bacterium]
MIHNALKFFISGLKMVYFLLGMLIKENFVNYIKKAGTNDICTSKRLILLGNGPSLMDVIKNWRHNDIFRDADVLAVNYFCHDDSFVEIKPKYYILSDPQFFDDGSLLIDKVNKMYEYLNGNVTWQMFLYVQYYAWRKIDWKEKIHNANIKVIPFHSLKYSGYDSLRNLFFKHGIGSGNYGTVILNGEFIGLNLGYKKLYLYGVDHNFFDSICINSDNQLCNIVTHFYDSSPILKPMTHHWYSGKETVFRISEYLQDKAGLFHGHEILQEFADYCGANIYNCTKNSLIDAYERYNDT